MIETQEALWIAIVVLLPGAIASRVWRHTARMRAGSNEQDRITSLLVWSAVHVGILLLLGGRALFPAIDHARSGDVSYCELAGIAASLVLSPYLLGLAAGKAFMRWPRVFRTMALVGPGGKTPWDWVAGGDRTVQIPFVDRGVEYIGEVEHSDGDGDEILLVALMESRPEGWIPVTDMTGAILLKKGERDNVLWIREVTMSTGELFRYRTLEDLSTRAGHPQPIDHSVTAALDATRTEAGVSEPAPQQNASARRKTKRQRGGGKR